MTDRPPIPPLADDPALPAIRPARRLILACIASVAIVAVLTPIDGSIAAAFRWIPVPDNDIKRVLETLQQFGDGPTMVIAVILIALLDPRRVRRVLDWILAAGIGAIVFNLIKALTGRLRPGYVDERSWIGPLGEFTTADGALARPIEFWEPGVHQALSMPSTHTAHAMIAAVFLGHLYPRLRPLVWPWVGVVMFVRVRLEAHWPSDTLVGALLAWALASVIVERYWGVRGLDWVWKRFVDRDASPAFGATRRADLEAWNRDGA